ncbi:amidohydrolase family protein [Myxococcota bacterium]|nr:amidohydrolase family protein [Myxococcota bacterium]
MPRLPVAAPLLAACLLVPAACTGPEAGDDDADDTADDDTAPDDDTTPTLPPCEPALGGGDEVMLRGTLLLPDPVVPDGWVAFSKSTGLITCVGTDCHERPGAVDATVVCTEGLVLPGLVDPHNHMQYNTLPRFRHDGLYEDRYDWQGDPDYWDFSDAYDALSSDRCRAMKWAEARELMGGVTAAMGSTDACLETMVRNLDEGEHATGIQGYDADMYSGRISNVDDGEAADILSDLESGGLDAYLPHVGEGILGSVRGEFDTLRDLGLVDPGVAVIHGTDFDTGQLGEMAAAGMTLVWSPRSNLDLYGRTSPVAIARNVGLRVAVGTDWVPSGSMNARDELACAARYNEGFLGGAFTDVEMLEMVTRNAAVAVGLEHLAGRLEEGYLADLAVVAGDPADPYRSLFRSEAQDVWMTVVGGDVLYGAPDLVAGLEATAWCETLDVCGEEREICVKRDASGDYGETLDEIRAALQGALDDAASAQGITPDDPVAYAYQLSALFECGAPEEVFACEPSGGLAEGDADRDGVADAEDVCPAVHDPEQWDLDGDGAGDACDPCPLDPDPECESGSPDDPDGDGVHDPDDNCPTDANPGQEDADSDGKGDACDPCPDQPNPGGTGCTVTIPMIRDPSREDHVPEGTPVRVTGAVVTAVVADGAEGGFWVRDPEVEDFGAIHVYEYGAPSGVEVGDVVDVEGTYVEYYGQSEIDDASWTVTGTIGDVAPVLVDSEEIATGGALAEVLESHLVEVDGRVVVIDDNPDGEGGSGNDYDEFLVTGDLRVDDGIWDYPHDPQVDDEIVLLRGILTYTYENNKLLPRGDEDLVFD